MTTYSLDTDTFTKLLKKHPGNKLVVDRFRQEIGRNSLFLVCPVVFYEIRRELVLKGASTQLFGFDRLVESMSWKEFNAPIWERACSLWADLRSQGQSHNDTDVLIAAHSVHYGAVLVSGNVDHFRGTGATIENWS